MVSKKEQRKELLDKLADAENEIEYLQYNLIPKTIKELKKLKPTKVEIKDYQLESYPEWK